MRDENIGPTPEFLARQAEAHSRVERGGLDFLLSRKSISKAQHIAGSMYARWYWKRHSNNALTCSLGRNVVSPLTSEDAVQESRYMAIMAAEDLYRVCADKLQERGIKSGKHFWKALDIVAVHDGNFDDFREWLHTSGLHVGRDTARKWVKDALNELRDIIREIEEIHKRTQETV